MCLRAWPIIWPRTRTMWFSSSSSFLCILFSSDTRLRSVAASVVGRWRMWWLQLPQARRRRAATPRLTLRPGIYLKAFLQSFLEIFRKMPASPAMHVCDYPCVSCAQVQAREEQAQKVVQSQTANGPPNVYTPGHTYASAMRTGEDGP